jgi:fatty acid desaturase
MIPYAGPPWQYGKPPIQHVSQTSRKQARRNRRVFAFVLAVIFLILGFISTPSPGSLISPSIFLWASGVAFLLGLLQHAFIKHYNE